MYLELCNFEEDIAEIDKEIGDLEEVAKNNQINEHQEIRDKKVVDSDLMETSIRKETLRREWDKPKLKEKIWEKHIQKLRNQRKKCFAPPMLYESTNSKKTKRGKGKNINISSNTNIKETQDEKSNVYKLNEENTDMPNSTFSGFSNNFFSMYPPPPPPMYTPQSTFFLPPFYNPYAFQQYTQNLKFDLNSNSKANASCEDGKSSSN